MGQETLRNSKCAALKLAVSAGHTAVFNIRLTGMVLMRVFRDGLHLHRYFVIFLQNMG